MQGMQERNWEVCGEWVCVCVCVCVCPILYPPCIYRREPPAAAPQTDLEEHPGGDTWRSWGGGAHGPGRSTIGSAGLPWPPTVPNRWGLGLSGSPCLIHIGVGLSWLVLLRFLGYFGPFEPKSVLWYFLWGQSVLVTCILAQKHILHILEGKVWFRNFIEYKYMQEMQTLMIFLITFTPENGR